MLIRVKAMVFITAWHKIRLRKDSGQTLVENIDISGFVCTE